MAIAETMIINGATVHILDDVYKGKTKKDMEDGMRELVRKIKPMLIAEQEKKYREG